MKKYAFPQVTPSLALGNLESEKREQKELVLTVHEFWIIYVYKNILLLDYRDLTKLEFSSKTLSVICFYM